MIALNVFVVTGIKTINSTSVCSSIAEIQTYKQGIEEEILYTF